MPPLLVIVAAMCGVGSAVASTGAFPLEAVNATCELLDYVGAAVKFSAELRPQIEENAFAATESWHRTSDEVSRARETYRRGVAVVSGGRLGSAEMAQAAEALKRANDAEEMATKAEVQTLLMERKAQKLGTNISRLAQSIVLDFRAVPVVPNNVEEEEGEKKGKEGEAAVEVYKCPQRGVQNFSSELLQAALERLEKQLEGHAKVPRLDNIRHLLSNVTSLENTANAIQALLKATTDAELEAQAAANEAVEGTIGRFKAVPPQAIRRSDEDLDSTADGFGAESVLLSFGCLLSLLFTTA